MLATFTALIAIGIDLILPAFDDIRAEFDLAPDSTAVAGTVTFYFLGLAGQVLMGPLTDRYGRRAILYLGFGIYLLGALASAAAPSLIFLFAARFVWGFGAAATRVASMAVVRDVYEGDAMARTMSFLMAIFMIAPIIGPSIGAGVIALTNWRFVALTCGAAVIAMAIWAMRLPETLAPADRRSLDLRSIAEAAGVVVGTRATRGYILAMVPLAAAFTSYLASSELIIADVFDREAQFPLIFGGISVLIGAATLVNARLVRVLGAQRVVQLVLGSYIGVSAISLVIVLAADGRPTFWAYVPFLALGLAGQTMLTPNMTALAMAPMAAVAGTAAAILGSVTMASGAILGALIDRQIQGTVTPLAAAMLASGVLALAMVWRTTRAQSPVADSVL